MHYRLLHIGILIIRVGLGIMFLIHGLPKLFGGVEKWEKLGGAMQNFGIDFAPTFWGFMAAFAESIGAIALITGLFFRPMLSLLICTMLVATVMHYSKGSSLPQITYPLELMLVFVGLLVAGPGNYSLQEIFGKRDGQD